MIRLNLQTVVVVGLVYWFFIRKKEVAPMYQSGGIPIKGEGYP
jgi:hypothetical protein